MWKIASVCAVGLVAASLSVTAAVAAPAFSAKPVAAEAAPLVETVAWTKVCNRYGRCWRVWVPFRRHHHHRHY
jgi:hypothetical protein